MKRIKINCYLGLACVLLFFSPVDSHLRFIGPNPYFSYQTFPQDARMFNAGSSIFFLNLTNQGWMGNLDHPEMSPSPNYVATEESVSENYHSSKIAEARFKGTWFAPSVQAIPMVITWNKFKVIPIFSGELDQFQLNSSGEAIGHEEDHNYLIPFESKLSQRNFTGSAGILAVGEIGGSPIGLKFVYQRFEEESPSGYLSYSFNGSETNLNQYNWGWSTVSGCNHIFGISTNIDSFWQNSYTHTRYSLLDFTLGGNIGTHKAAIHIRRHFGKDHYYTYSSSQNDYLKQKWGSQVNKTMLRGYDVFKFLQIGGAQFYMVALVEADFERNPYLWEDIKLEDQFIKNTYAAEVLPFVHFDLSRGGFFRIGTSASLIANNYSYKEIWGSQEVYSHGWATFDWEKPWERSSYGRSYIFTNFSEANLEIVAADKPHLAFRLDFWSHLALHYTDRFYGRNRSDGSGIYSFQQQAHRKNFLRELWMSGTFGFQIGRRISWGLYANLPIYYDPFQTTEITGNSGEYFSGVSNSQPQIRRPLQLQARIIVNW
ncbi:MAG: hypothetical protein GF421_10415 [Candidatus Aminicenantes bacterium]|nr:hypothetical protein [Candidatus Aminicenantes bacterium]